MMCNSPSILLIGFAEGQMSTSLFLCEHSTTVAGQVFIPNVPDFYFNHQNAAAFITGQNANLTALSEATTTYIVTIPSVSSQQRDCSGNFTSVQYCYQLNTSLAQRALFSLNFFTRNGLRLTIESNFDRVPLITESDCTVVSEDLQVCCETTQLPPRDQVAIPTSEISFGLASRHMQFLAFADSATEYNVERIDAGFTIFGRVRGSISVGEDRRFTNRSIALFRFLKGNVISELGAGRVL